MNPDDPSAAPVFELVLGGARSGKSRYAETQAMLASAAGLRVIYVATAQAGDDEMTARIAHHRSRRPTDWTTVESPIQLAATLEALARPDTFILVDCLTLWLSNLLHADALPTETHCIADTVFVTERSALLDLLPKLPGRMALVSNEVGWGIVPMGALARRFCDEQGRLNQDIAALADRVTLVTAGLPLCLKG